MRLRSSDNGGSITDNKISATTPILKGEAEAGSMVYLTSSINGAVDRGITDGAGNCKVSSTTLDDGSQNIAAKAKMVLVTNRVNQLPLR